MCINTSVGQSNLKMNYLKLYCKLVRKFEERGLTKEEAKKQGLYTESHHIFPRSIFGEHKEGNQRTVFVSAREHYILHAVLEKLCIQRYGLNHPYTRKMNTAHISMSTKKETNEMIYVNSRLYETARIRQSQLNSGRNHPSTLHLKIYFEDGRIVDYPDGASGFCKDYPEYTRNSISGMGRGKHIGKHKDIIKVEVLNPEKIPKRRSKEEIEWTKKHPKNTNAISVRIWFGDGRIYDCWEGLNNFCNKNQKYDMRQLHRFFRKKGEQTYYKDIVKIEVLDKNSPTNPEPIYFKITRSKVKPVRFTFKDGTTLDWYDGIKEFCKQNPQYRPGNLNQVKSGMRKSCGNIIKIEDIILESIEGGPKILELSTENLAKCEPFRVYYNDGRIEEWYESKTDFIKSYPQYTISGISKLLSGVRQTHKDILKIEIIDPNDNIEPTPMYSLSRKKNALPIRIFFSDGSYEDCYEGAREFCKKYPHKNYSPGTIANVKLGIRPRHKDIVKVEEIDHPNNQQAA
jgi:hypothetical protein